MGRASNTRAELRHEARAIGNTLSVAPIVEQRREILKIGLAVTERGRLLVVRKKGTSSYILPGGKPELGENDLQALAREIEEELGCKLAPNSIAFLGSFSDIAADLQNTKVTIRLYAADLLGDPSPQSEIENIRWHRPTVDSCDPLAPSLKNHIVPFLCAQGLLSAHP